MNINNINDRESTFLDFIDKYNDDKIKSEGFRHIQSDPIIQRRKLNLEYEKGKSICLDAILGKIYKDALPFDDPQKNCSCDTAKNIMHDYVDKRTDGKGSEWYIREAIRRTNSSTLKAMINEAESMMKEFYQEKSKDIGRINIKDLDFHINISDDQMDKITKRMDLDDISEIIQKNVQQTIQDEVDKSKREAEYAKEIEDNLADDIDVQDDASMESAIEKMNIVRHPTIYQPSLFEAIMTRNASIYKESTNENILSETIHEYTKLNISKALMLERFTLSDIKKMASDYFSNK